VQRPHHAVVRSGSKLALDNLVDAASRLLGADSLCLTKLNAENILDTLYRLSFLTFQGRNYAFIFVGFLRCD